MQTGGQWTVWMLAVWWMVHSEDDVVGYGMHHSVAATSATHTDSSPDDDYVPRPAAVTASL